MKGKEFYKAMGFTDRELELPLVAIVNSWNELVPGHIHLRQKVEAVKAGVRLAGGTPLEFDTIALCDGIVSHQYSLPSRDLIADSIELTVRGYRFDAAVFICSCDKIVPGHLMAAARLDIPSIFLTGGPMIPGVRRGERVMVPQLAAAMAGLARGEITVREWDEMNECAFCTVGSCVELWTANTMGCLTEALGMSLPGCGTCAAVASKKVRLAKETGVQIMQLLKRGIRPSDILTREAFENAIKVDMALGGSTNTLLHVPAIASELGIEIRTETFDRISRLIPHLCPLSPGGSYAIEDLDRAGGVPAVMKELEDALDARCLTVTGNAMGKNIEGARTILPDVIRSRRDPVHREGGLAVLKGNLAPQTAVVKTSGIRHHAMLAHEGPARVFDSQEEALDSIRGGNIRRGDVVVIRYEGPRGGPGMREMADPMHLICGLGMDDSVAVITDGRWSGSNYGCAIGHVCPEAMEGGPIAVVQNGDRIRIDIPGRRVDIALADLEIAARLKKWKPREPRVARGFLARYARMVKPASEGAILTQEPAELDPRSAVITPGGEERP
jgi:dihydroxy-acid dehydratase